MNKINLYNKNYYLIFKSSLLLLFIASLFSPLIIKDYIDIRQNNFILNIFAERTTSFILQIFLTIIYFIENIKNKFKINLVPINKYILIIFSYSIINLLIFRDALFILNTTYYLKYFLQIVFMIFLTNEFLNNRNILRLSVLLYFIFSLILSLFLITDSFTLMNEESGRITLIGWKENDLSLYFSLAYSILISYLADFKSIKNKYFFIFLIPCSLILIKAVILTGTRAGLLTIISTNLLLLFSISLNKFNIFKKTIIIFSNCIFFILNTINNTSINDRVLVDNFNNAGGRLVHWLFALKITSKNPIFGVGLENYQKLSFLEIGQWDPQNLFIELYAITGIIPILIILILISSTIYKSFILLKKSALSSHSILLIPIFIHICLFNLWNYKVLFLFLSIYSCNSEYIDLKFKSLNKLARN